VGLDYTLGQVESLALREVERVGQLLKTACLRFGRNCSPEQVIKPGPIAVASGQTPARALQGRDQGVADGFRRAEAVSFPKGDELQVRPVPEFLRSMIPTAAYTQPGAFEKSQRGIFWATTSV